MLRGCKGWIKIEIILGDTGYDTRECFDEIDEFGAIPGIKVRKNSSTLSKVGISSVQLIVQHSRA